MASGKHSPLPASPFNLAAYGGALSLLLGGCASVPVAGTPENPLAATTPEADVINWPAKYHPNDAVFYVHNEIEIEAPPQAVWEVLMDAESWPSWYEGASDVAVQNRDDGRLDADGIFTWRTMDLNFTPVVKEFEPPYSLSWESRRGLIQGYHAWLIVPTADGSRVITDESQHGFLATMQRWFLKDKLHGLHDSWLLGIKTRAEATTSVHASAKMIND